MREVKPIWIVIALHRETGNLCDTYGPFKTMDDAIAFKIRDEELFSWHTNRVTCLSPDYRT